MIGVIKRYVVLPVIIIISLCILYLTLLSVIFLPSNDLVRENVNQGLDQITIEGTYPSAFSFFSNANGYSDFSGTTLDNYTDEIMIRKAIKDDGLSAFSAAVTGYTRYWHGYLVVLRPLLMVMSYFNIRYLNILVHILLLCGAFYSVSKGIGTRYAFLYVYVWASVYLVIFPQSLQFSTVTLLTHIFVITMILLININKLHKKNLYLFFLTTGSVVAFFDFWTFPLVTLGLPLILIQLIYSEESKNLGIYSHVKFQMLLSIYWAIGLTSTLFMKWWISSVFTGAGALEDAFSQLYSRSILGSNGVISGFTAIEQNVRLIVENKPLTMSLIIGVFSLFNYIMLFNRKDFKTRFCQQVPILVPSLYPFVWILITSNHSYVHFWYVYRILITSIFSVFAFLISLNKRYNGHTQARKEQLNLSEMD